MYPNNQAPRYRGILSIILLLGGTLGLLGPLAAAAQGNAPETVSTGGAEHPTGLPSTEQLEGELQGLSWEQFRSVVSAIPKLKADVDAYGPLGWQYVERNYRSYAWRRNLAKLDTDQTRQLVALIAKARGHR